MMLSCRDVTRRISESMDRPLTRRERRALRLHLLICRFCVRYERQLLLIRDTVRRIAAAEGEPAGPATESLSAEARERIRISLGRC